MPDKEYSPDKRARDGLQGRCRECSRDISKAARHASPELREKSATRSRAWRAANRETHARSAKLYREKHRESLKVSKHEYYEKVKNNPEFEAKSRAYREAKSALKSEYDRQYRLKDPQKTIERSRKWRVANPDKRRAIVLSYTSRRRSWVSGGASTGELRGWIDASPKVCAYCDMDCSMAFHVDHYFPLSKGGKHEIENLRIACPTCNLKKNAKLPEVWLAHLAEAA